MAENTKKCAALSAPLHCLSFFFNDTATTEIYTLSLHDALPISAKSSPCSLQLEKARTQQGRPDAAKGKINKFIIKIKFYCSSKMF